MRHPPRPFLPFSLDEQRRLGTAPIKREYRGANYTEGRTS